MYNSNDRYKIVVPSGHSYPAYGVGEKIVYLAAPASECDIIVDEDGYLFAYQQYEDGDTGRRLVFVAARKGWIRVERESCTCNSSCSESCSEPNSE